MFSGSNPLFWPCLLPVLLLKFKDPLSMRLLEVVKVVVKVVVKEKCSSESFWKSLSSVTTQIRPCVYYPFYYLGFGSCRLRRSDLPEGKRRINTGSRRTNMNPWAGKSAEDLLRSNQIGHQTGKAIVVAAPVVVTPVVQPPPVVTPTPPKVKPPRKKRAAKTAEAELAKQRVRYNRYIDKLIATNPARLEELKEASRVATRIWHHEHKDEPGRKEKAREHAKRQHERRKNDPQFKAKAAADAARRRANKALTQLIDVEHV